MLLAQIPLAAQDTPGPKRPDGGTLVWGVCQKPAPINPVLTTSTVSATIVQLVFNSLVRRNSQGEIAPDLAYSWDISSDGLVYTFYLRKGVRFHDGRELTAEDVKFTFDRIIDPEIRSPFRSAYEPVEDFKAAGKYAFQVRLKKPYAAFLSRMVRYIIPKHILENNSHPVGSGPFRFKQWTKDDRIILEANNDYYEGRPHLDRIEVKVYANSRDIWVAFMRQEVDFVLFIEREDYEVVRNDPAFKAYAFAIDHYYALVYNLEDLFLSDMKVREALAYGVDRKGLIERAGFGYGLECAGPFHPQSLGFNPEVKPFEYNPQKAKELLAQAGFRDLNNDGILEKEGEELAVKVLIDSRNAIYERMAMVLRQQLQEIGIKIKIVFYDNNSLLNREYLTKEKTQAHLTLLFGGLDPAQKSSIWSYTRKKEDNRLWPYKNEEVEKLFVLGESVLDNKDRKEIYQWIHKIIYQEQPVCFLYYPFMFHALSDKFANAEDFFTLNMPHYTMKDWYIKTDTKKKGGER
ncbi:MAG: ABC transporter substrate-binding protein [Candidatus Omnitrophota bacterium]|nr:ABC transporter substrate-binding protein [Candidatus Omnitrophota bacterium]